MNSGWKAAWLLTLGSGLLLGSACSVDREVATVIRRELPKVLGPAERYDVRVRGANVRDNRVQEASVIAVGLRPRPNFRIDRLEAAAWEVQVNPRTRSITRLGNLEATVTITAADTENFVASKPWQGRVSLESVTITFPGENRASLAATATFSGLTALGFDLSPRVPIEADGELVPDGGRVSLRVSKIRAAKLTLPSVTHRWVEEAVNPIADLSGLPIALEVSGFQGDGDRIQARIRQRGFQPKIP